MSKTRKDVMTDPLLHKGHKHNVPTNLPAPCPYCYGFGILRDGKECTYCEGTGEVYDR